MFGQREGFGMYRYEGMDGVILGRGCTAVPVLVYEYRERVEYLGLSDSSDNDLGCTRHWYIWSSSKGGGVGSCWVQG